MAGTKPRRLHPKQICFQPYKDNWKEIQAEDAKTEAGHAEVIRILVDEALRARRLRQLGSDTVAKPYQQLAKDALAAELSPLKNSLVEIAHVINEFRDEIKGGSRTQPGLSGSAQVTSFDIRMITLLLLTTLSKVIANINITWTCLGSPALAERHGLDPEDLSGELEKYMTDAQSDARAIEQTFRENIQPRTSPSSGTATLTELRQITTLPDEVPN